MSGDKFRVIINTDEYACYIESDDDIELQVEEALPIVNTIDNLIICITLPLAQIQTEKFLE